MEQTACSSMKPTWDKASAQLGKWLRMASVKNTEVNSQHRTLCRSQIWRYLFGFKVIGWYAGLSLMNRSGTCYSKGWRQFNATCVFLFFSISQGNVQMFKTFGVGVSLARHFVPHKQGTMATRHCQTKRQGEVEHRTLQVPRMGIFPCNYTTLSVLPLISKAKWGALFFDVCLLNKLQRCDYMVCDMIDFWAWSTDTRQRMLVLVIS